MTFTNNDLKQLMEQAEQSWERPVELSSTEVIALLARLEAAELCAAYFLDAIHESNRAPVENEALNQWRKACGRGA